MRKAVISSLIVLTLIVSPALLAADKAEASRASASASRASAMEIVNSVWDLLTSIFDHAAKAPADPQSFCPEGEEACTEGGVMIDPNG